MSRHSNPPRWAARRVRLRCALVILAAVVGSPGVSADESPEKYSVRRILNLQYCDAEPGVRAASVRCDVFLPVTGAPPEGESPNVSEPTASRSEKTAPGSPESTARRWPVVLVVHGGAWAAGDKWTMDQHSKTLAEGGHAAVAINYRHAPAHKFPRQVDDVRAALVWIHENADRYGFDLDRVGLYGYSAGGHLVSLVATASDEQWEKVRFTTSWAQDDPRWGKMPCIKAVCAGGPPTDFESLPPDNTSLAYFLGGSRREQPNSYQAASPINFVSPQDPPIQLIHGETDGIVPITGSRNFLKRLLGAGVTASLEALPRKGHLLTFISPQLTATMLEFFEEHLSESAAP